jgi:hypothetical protein
MHVSVCPPLSSTAPPVTKIVIRCAPNRRRWHRQSKVRRGTSAVGGAGESSRRGAFVHANTNPSLVLSADLNPLDSLVKQTTPRPQPGAPAGGPAVDAAYRALTRKRTLASLQKGRSVSVITDGRAAQRLYQQQHNRASLYVKHTAADKEEYEARSARDLKGAGGPARRTRMERPELEQLLFRLFERQPHWAFPALQRETDQPGGWLREVLGEVALQVKRGPHKDLWELQRQFKLGGGGAAAGGAAAAGGEGAGA